MSLKNNQKDVDDWVSQFEEGYWKPHEIMVRLAEEIGELAREINHRHGPKKKKETENIKEIGDEIVDIFFTLICLANSQGIDLDDSWKKLVEEKMYGRDNQRFKRKE